MTEQSPHADADTMICLERASKRYRGQEADAVAPLSMDIKRGEFVVFVGPSGCGKTTTLRMINRLVEPSSGQVWIDGDNVTDVDVDQLRRRIGYVIQQVGLLPHLTVANNVALVPKLLGLDKKSRTKRAEELLELVGLDPATFADRYPRQLSGGQQQRVGVARALAADPPVMLMDEPFGAVDPIARERLQEEFLKLQARIGKTIVFVTHDIDEALRLGDRIAIFAEGSRLAQFATPLEILTNPADDFVRDFVGGGAPVRRLSLLKIGDVLAGSAYPDPSSVLRRTIDAELDESVHRVLERVLAAGAEGVSIASADGGCRTVALQDLLTDASRPAGTPA